MFRYNTYKGFASFSDHCNCFRSIYNTISQHRCWYSSFSTYYGSTYLNIDLHGGLVFWNHQRTSKVVSEKIKVPLVPIMSRMKGPNRHGNSGCNFFLYRLSISTTMTKFYREFIRERYVFYIFFAYLFIVFQIKVFFFQTIILMIFIFFPPWHYPRNRSSIRWKNRKKSI